MSYELWDDVLKAVGAWIYVSIPETPDGELHYIVEYDDGTAEAVPLDQAEEWLLQRAAELGLLPDEGGD